MSDESSGRKRALKQPEDPVHTCNGKWFFYDEDFWAVGPYDTEAAARRRLEHHINQTARRFG
jgi:hypothetical protein